MYPALGLLLIEYMPGRLVGSSCFWGLPWLAGVSGTGTAPVSREG